MTDALRRYEGETQVKAEAGKRRKAKSDADLEKAEGPPSPDERKPLAEGENDPPRPRR